MVNAGGERGSDNADYSKYKTTSPGNQGWGITYDESNQEFIVSDGSAFLYYWDRDSLREKRKVKESRLFFVANNLFLADERASLMISLFVHSFVAVYSLVALVGLCTGLADPWTCLWGIFVSLSVLVFGLVSLIFILPPIFLAKRLCS